VTGPAGHGPDTTVGAERPALAGWAARGWWSRNEPGPAEDDAGVGERVGTLVSVNVGLPRDVEWQGRTVHTGVWKHPVDGRRRVRRGNVDGDGQGDLAGHGGEQRAVLVYQLDSYRHWRGELGRDDLSPGAFGENFTVDGLPDREVRIGDRYRIGTALFEVTQPRVTCYRVGMRLGEPRIPALLVAHHRPGFYLRVLEEGEVGAGDPIELAAAGPLGMTVVQVDALLYLPGHSRALLRRAVDVPALSPGWRASFRAMLDAPDTGAAGNAGLGPAAPPPAWPGFRPLRVTAVEPESSTVSSLWLADPDGMPLPAAGAGQFVAVRFSAPPRRTVLRSYSLSGPPGAPDYRISVQREPHGTGSRLLLDTVRPGTLLDTAAPRGGFVLQPAARPVLLVSAGVGATPVLAMLHALAGTRSAREVWWMHTARDGAHHPFRDEADALLGRLPHARRHVRYTRPRPSDRGHDATGRPTRLALADLGLPTGAAAYLCGPAAFLTDVTAALTDLGLDPDRIHTEVFGAMPGLTPGIRGARPGAPHPPPGPPGPGPAVTFTRSGLTTSWSPAHASLLELAEACAVPVRWSCRTGVCQTCRTGLVAGTVAYAPQPLDPPVEGEVLICCARPANEVVLDL
jgi:ferredoxin-NADP reductase/MOSC domain-containing protein YiiM